MSSHESITEERDLEEEKVLFGAFDSFFQYPKTAAYNTTHLRRQSFYALPRAHIELLSAPPFSFLDTLEAVDDGIDKNAELATAILRSGLESFASSVQNETAKPKASAFDNPTSTLGNEKPIWLGKATSNDLEKGRSTLRQFYRDWSAEGATEREACYGPIITALQRERQALSSAPMSVLVPGAGLGRLVFELCCLGFNTEGNEISYHQLLGSSYILNYCPTKNTHTLFPWIQNFSNHMNRKNHLRSVMVPDIHPGTVLNSIEHPGEMSMSASDFLMLYGDNDHKDLYDAVATVFFLDTAPNIIRYFETIKHCLKKGGLLINIGPLLWHFENNSPGTHGRKEDLKSKTSVPSASSKDSIGIADPGSVELTDEEVVALVEKMGFDLEKKEDGISAPYIQDPESMLQNTYKASHWVARKK